MKRLILPVIAILLITTSCIGDIYDNGSNTELQTVNITIRPNQWVVDGTPGHEGACLISEWSVPQLTQEVLKYGIVQTLYTFYDESYPYQLVEHPLPYVLPYAGSPSNVIETYRCFYELGKVTFVIESQDFQCYVPNENVDFKITMLRNRY